jgi:hypothetical protein
MTTSRFMFTTVAAVLTVGALLTMPLGKAESEKPTLPDGCCDHCGSRAGVRRACVVKEVVREKKKVCWDAECEPHCIPGPSVYCGTCSGKDECGCYEYDIWKPTCGRVVTKTVPKKTVVVRKVPGFEWAVEERCASCRQRLAGDPGCATH